VRTITFYSYKGGTGRSLLLANVAVLAGSIGKRAVALDFDLEAPGQSYKLLHDGRPPAAGLVGWVRDALSGDAPAVLDDYVVDVPLSEPFVPGGWLKLMPAGRAPSPNYFQDLRRLDLDRALDGGRGIDVLLELQQRLEDELDADFLLIDARTGITPTNAVTTQVLADDIVVLALDTPEQLEGTRSVLRALQPLTSLRTEQPIGLHIVLSRIAPRPPDAGISGLTPAEQEQIERVRAFLNEPAQPLANTLDVRNVHLLHNDLELQRRELLFLERPGQWTRSALHVDYLLIGKALYGDDVEDAATRALGEARADAERLQAVAHFFARPEELLEARGALSREPEPTQHGDVGLEQQVAVLRERVASDPSLRPDLASLLVLVSSRLGELGRREEALAPVEEAVALYRELAGASPQAFTPDLAGSLNNLSNRLDGLGRGEEALGAIEEAVVLRRELADASPQAFTPDLAKSLNNLSNRLDGLGRGEEALGAIEEAVALYRELAGASPQAFTPDLAMSLNNLSAVLGGLGRGEEALGVIEEAVVLYRELADASPQAFTPDFVGALNNLSIVLRSLGREQEAKRAAQEAEEAGRRLLRRGDDA
jgi:tetratricopeptide (TPR) repeat protein/MinD-like ATPase involved in chromosome partitioning or flagellar assembly